MKKIILTIMSCIIFAYLVPISMADNQKKEESFIMQLDSYIEMSARERKTNLKRIVNINYVSVISLRNKYAKKVKTVKNPFDIRICGLSASALNSLSERNFGKFTADWKKAKALREKKVGF